MKTFIALEFDNNTKKLLGKLQKKVKENSLKGRWVYYKNFHMTIKYIGNTTPDQVDELYNVLKSISSKAESLDLALDNLGFFKGKDILRVVWLGLKGDVDQLIDLSNKIDTKVSEVGFARNKRDFIPHITLGRDILFDSTIFKINENIKNELNHKFRFDSLTLLSSEVVDNKRVYNPIHRFKL